MTNVDIISLQRIKHDTELATAKFEEEYKELHEPRWIEPFSQDLLKIKQPHQNIFIETGTATGASIEAALRAGFKEIYSIEVNPFFCLRAQNVFKNDPVTIISGTSEIELPQLLQKTRLLDEGVFFWLDAHWSGGPFLGEKMAEYLPRELECLAQLNQSFDKSSFALDDMGFYNGKEHEPILNKFKDQLKRVKRNADPELYYSKTDHIYLTSS
jgi:hypothetical protein